MTRSEARDAIVTAARKHRQRRQARDGLRFLLPAITARHLQRAVHICRANGLVSDDVLVAAGFNPQRKRPR